MPIPRKYRCHNAPAPHLGLDFTSRLIDIAAKNAESSTERSEIKTQIALLRGRLRSKSWGLLVDSASYICEQQYHSPEEHFLCNQLASLIRKVPFKDPTLTPEQNAWDKFLASEQACKDTNARFTAFSSEMFSAEEYLGRARNWIRRVLGESPDFKSIFERCDFGPGASVGVHGECTHKGAKLTAEKWSVTGSAYDYARVSMMGDHHIWEYLLGGAPFCFDSDLFREKFDAKASIVQANKITMVPKTAKVHRTIAIEPLLNGYVQKGVDLHMRDKLRKIGINLNDQTRNQRLAKLGSEGGFDPLVTIDLSSASDSISIQLVKNLLPPDWYDFLNAIRSPCYESSYGSGKYEKFTSMGNGFCFPLETLIFAALIVSVYQDVATRTPIFSVYGDDIIVHQSAALLLTERLAFCGFKINSDKSFLFGPFRESCGADYFEGVYVRPYTLDFIPENYRDVVKILNGIRNSPFVQKDIWGFCFSRIPEKVRFVRPYSGPPDTAIEVDLDTFMSSPFSKWCKKIQGWKWTEYITTAVTDKRDFVPSIQMYGLLRGSSAEEGRVAFALRRKTRTRTRLVPSPSGIR